MFKKILWWLCDSCKALDDKGLLNRQNIPSAADVIQFGAPMHCNDCQKIMLYGKMDTSSAYPYKMTNSGIR